MQNPSYDLLFIETARTEREWAKRFEKRKQRLVRAALEYREPSRIEEGKRISNRQRRAVVHIAVDMLIHGELMLKLSGCHRSKFLLPLGK